MIWHVRTDHRGINGKAVCVIGISNIGCINDLALFEAEFDGNPVSLAANTFFAAGKHLEDHVDGKAVGSSPLADGDALALKLGADFIGGTYRHGLSSCLGCKPQAAEYAERLAACGCPASSGILRPSLTAIS